MNSKSVEAYKLMVLGQQITVRTHLSPEEMKDLVILVEEHFDKVKRQASTHAPLQKLHLLAMLSIAEKVITLRARVNTFRKEIVGEMANMKQYIDRFTKHPRT